MTALAAVAAYLPETRVPIGELTEQLQLRERDILRGRPLTRILEEREQCQQQQDNNDPEGEIAQIGVHRTSFVAARIAALCLWAGTDGFLEEFHRGRLACNLGAAPIDAKGTA